MRFMDPKEEVLDVQLTQYGKYLMSRGKLSPAYYAFFDDDVVYDNDYAGGKEIQNMAEKRILEDTPRLQGQYIYTGAETRIKQVLRAHKDRSLKDDRTTYNRGSETIPVLPVAEKHFATSAPMGTSDPTSDFAPSWEVQVLKGDLSGAVKQISGSYATTRIPQLNFVVEYKVSGRALQRDENADPDFQSPRPGVEKIFSFEADPNVNGKGSVLEYMPDDVVLYIAENNGIYTNQNFDVEVFQISSSNPETLSGTPLGEQVIDLNRPNPIIPTEQLSFIDMNLEIGELVDVDPTYVAHFLDVLVDREIDMCQVKLRDEQKSLFDMAEFDCPEPGPGAIDVYDIALTEADYEEPCD